MQRCLAMLLACAGIAIPLGPAAHAHAEDGPPPALITAIALKYLPGGDEVPQAPLVVERGGSLIFFNADDLGVHSIYSMDSDAQGNPLFWVEQQNLGSFAEVAGVPALSPGSYRFLCSNHPEMRGTLTVADDGSGASQ